MRASSKTAAAFTKAADSSTSPPAPDGPGPARAAGVAKIPLASISSAAWLADQPVSMSWRMAAQPVYR